MPVMAGSRSTMMSLSGHCAVSPLPRRNFLFLGSDAGGERAAILYTVLESAKPNGLDPQAWLSDVIDRLANGHRSTAWANCCHGTGSPKSSPSPPERPRADAYSSNAQPDKQAEQQIVLDLLYLLPLRADRVGGSNRRPAAAMLALAALGGIELRPTGR